MSAPRATVGVVSNAGAIYTCPVARGPCTGLEGDMTGDDNRLFDTEGEHEYSMEGVFKQETLHTLWQSQIQLIALRIHHTRGGRFFLCNPLSTLQLAQ